MPRIRKSRRHDDARILLIKAANIYFCCQHGRGTGWFSWWDLRVPAAVSRSVYAVSKKTDANPMEPPERRQKVAEKKADEKKEIKNEV